MRSLLPKMCSSRLEQVKGRILPDGVDVHVVRNYGETAADKANELLNQLVGATITIVLLITIFVGWREGAVVLMVIPATILLTFFSAWLLGYTVNRVSMFALIFSIGILVDDAIVVVENINRHWRMTDDRSRIKAAIDAVAEVGNPTLIANFTIIAALLPMMFVSGLMGPYMSPIPANASFAVIFSYLIAVTVTPWLIIKLGGRAAARSADVEPEQAAEPVGAFGRLISLDRPANPEEPTSFGRVFATGRDRDDRCLRPVRDQRCDGQALAVRQQVGAAGGDRLARGIEPGSD